MRREYRASHTTTLATTTYVVDLQQINVGGLQTLELQLDGIENVHFAESAAVHRLVRVLEVHLHPTEVAKYNAVSVTGS